LRRPAIADVAERMKAVAAPVGEPWLWTLAFRHHEDRTPDPRLCSDAHALGGAAVAWPLAVHAQQSAMRRRLCSALGNQDYD
jgi:hypothetical protein